MKKIIFFTAIGIILVFCASLVYAQQETNKIMQQLNKELEQEKVFLPNELKDMNQPLRNCLERGVASQDLKAILVDLKSKESSAKDTKKTIDLMVDLIKFGVSPKEAGNIVSQAAHQAHAQGLKGQALAAKVHEAIRLRKAEHERLKLEKKKEKQLLEQKITSHQEQDRDQESHGQGHGKGKK